MRSGQLTQLLAIVLLLLMIVGSVFFILPLRDKIAELRGEKEVLAQEVATLDSKVLGLQALAETVSTSETTKQSLGAAVPSGYAQDALIVEFSEMANDLGFTLNAVNFSDTVNEEFGKALNLSANFSGPYEELIAFLQKIETAKRLMRVLSLTLQRTDITNITFTLTVEAYYQ